MIDAIRGWGDWLRKEFDLRPGELGDLFAAFQIVSGFAGFILAVVVWIFTR